MLGNTRLMIAIAPDGSKVAALRGGDTDISLWNGEGEKLPSIEVQANATALALGPAGLLGVALTGGEVALWDLSFAKPKHLPSLILHQNFFNNLRFSPRNGSLLAATGMRGIELWDLGNHTQIADLKTEEMVEDLVFSPDGQTLAAGEASRIEFWSVVEPTGQHVLPETGEAPRGVAFGPDDLLAITSIDANGPAPLRLWGGPGRCPPTVHAWDQVHSSSVGFDGQGRLISLEPDALRWYEPPSNRPVNEVELSSLGRPGGRPENRPEGRPDRKSDIPPPPPAPATGPLRMPPSSMAARTPDGRTLLINRGNGPLQVWRSDAPSTFKRLELPDRIEPSGRGPLSNPLVGLDPSGSRIYYVSLKNDQLKLIARTFEGNEASQILWSTNIAPISQLAISPDGRWIAAGERTGATLLIETNNGIVKERLFTPDDETNPIESIAFGVEGKMLAVGSREQVRLWGIDGKARPLASLPGHRGSIRSLAFDSKGMRLAEADEKTIKVWDLGSLRGELARLGLDW
jgi:WD40 repeat protein